MIKKLCYLVLFFSMLSYAEQNDIALFQKNAEQGDAAAQNNLGYAYAKGEGVPQSYEKAAEWYRKAAVQGHAEAQHRLGLVYVHGRGVKQSYEEAVKWFFKAAEQGDAAAQYSLGLVYAKGQGVPQSHEEAVKWHLKAAEQGYAAAQYSLGVFYAKGQGVPQSHAEAVKWFFKAAEQGDAAAQYSLGLAYAHGCGIDLSYKNAAKWFHKAAVQGHTSSQYCLGLSYEKGLGLPQSHEEAVKWYRKAAEQGYAEGQYRIGVAHANGQGVEQSYKEAIKWFLLAAKQNNRLAQYSLSIYYKYGIGVSSSQEESAKWYNKLIERGNIQARELSEQMKHDSLEDVSTDETSATLEKDEALKILLSKKRGVFRIYARTNDGVRSGTGFLVSKKEGLVVTCSHVVHNATDISIFVLSDDASYAQEYSAKIVTENISEDFAIIKFKTQPETLPEPFKLANKAPEVLEEVVAMGFPAALDYPTVLTTSKSGSVICNSRFVENLTPNITKGTISKVGTQIIHDAKLAAGNSGGPLFSLKSGTVVGINTSMIQDSTEFYIAYPASQAQIYFYDLLEYNNDLQRLEIRVSGGDADAMVILATKLYKPDDRDKMNIHRSLLLLIMSSELKKHADELRQMGYTNREDPWYALGIMFLESEPKIKNIGLAMHFLHQSESIKAKEELCSIYVNGVKNSEYIIDKVEGFKFIKSFSESGNYSAHLALSKCYRYGIGTKKNVNESNKILRNLLEQELAKNKFYQEEIKYNLATSLLDSNNKQDIEEGICILKILAESVDALYKCEACNILGLCYFRGEKVKKRCKSIGTLF